MKQLRSKKERNRASRLVALALSVACLWGTSGMSLMTFADTTPQVPTETTVETVQETTPTELEVTEPEQTTVPEVPTEPTEPTEPTTPTEPVVPTEPTVPVEPVVEHDVPTCAETCKDGQAEGCTCECHKQSEGEETTPPAHIEGCAEGCTGVKEDGTPCACQCHGANTIPAPVTYTITLELCEAAEAGVTADPVTITVKEDGTFEYTLPKPEWNDADGNPVATFEGWFTDAERTVAVTAETVFAEGMVLYAKWAPTVAMFAEEIGESENFILVKKVFNGLPDKELVPSTFQISVTPEEGNPISKGLSDAVKVSEDGFEYTWKIPASAGSYTIGESGTDVQNYELISSTNIGTDVTVYHGQAEINLGDKDERYPSCSNSDILFPQKPNEGWIIAVAANDGLGVFILSEFDLSESVKNGIRAFTGYPNSAFVPSDGVTFYTVKGNEEVKVPGTDVTLKYFVDEHRIHIGATKQWRQACTLGFSMVDFYNPDITVTNTYTKKVTDITIRKDVTGNMGDVNKEFSFTVSCSDSNFEDVEFTLKDYDTSKLEKVIKNVPLGSKLTITENNGTGYVMKVGETVCGDEEHPSYSYQFTMPSTEPETPIVIVVENNKTVTIDTGILLDYLPYIIILELVGGGAVLLMKKRRNRDDD